MIQFQKVYHKPFPGNSEIRRMIEFDGELYIAVGKRTPKALRIFRLEHAGCKIWHDVTPSWKIAPGTYNLALAVFNGQLFIGTDAGEVHRIEWKVWPKPPPNQLYGSISSMAEFKNDLYAIASSLYRTSHGTQWTDLGPIKNLGPNEYTDGETVLEVFNGHLYAGFGTKKYASNTPSQEIEHGIEIWRTANGSNWKLFKSIPGDLTDPLYGLNPVPQHVHTMKAFGKHLYVGEYEGSGGVVFRTDGSSGSWEEYPALPGNIEVLEVHNGALYAGQYSLLPTHPLYGLPMLYSTTNGIKWSAVPGSPAGDHQTQGIMSIADYGGRLYFGTYDSDNGGEVFEMGDPVSFCKVADILDLSKKTADRLEKAKIDIEGAKTAAEFDPHDLIKVSFEDLGKALVRLPPEPTTSRMREMALDYLRPVEKELESMTYFTEVAATIEDPNDRKPILDAALDHAERALTGVSLFRTTLSDLGDRGRR